jgi:hypothetical protein
MLRTRIKSEIHRPTIRHLHDIGSVPAAIPDSPAAGGLVSPDGRSAQDR